MFYSIQTYANKWQCWGDRRAKKDGTPGQHPHLAERQDWPQAARLRAGAPSQGLMERVWGRTQPGWAGITKQGFLGKVSMSQRQNAVCAGCKVWEGHFGHRNRNHECLWVNRNASPHSKLPFLSPVSTQILMSAFASFEMVSGTPSWSLSSIAVAPKSCKEHLKKWISK